MRRDGWVLAPALRLPRFGRLVVVLAVTACGTLTAKEEEQLGHQAQREVRQSLQLMRDRVVVNYVRKMGKQLVTAAGPSASMLMSKPQRAAKAISSKVTNKPPSDRSW